MYIPAINRVTDPDELRQFMEAYSFATLVTAPEGVPFATHLPLLIQQDGDTLYLRSHLARANPQWQHFGERDVLVMFQGPHTLVHSNWYASAPNVPTWNYAAVHAYGQARVVEGDETRAIAYGLVQRHTPDMHAIPADFERRMLAGVVTFEVRVTRLEGKFKLSQNKNVADRAEVRAHLHASSDAQAQDVAALMEARETGR
ncbi:FMN-binding negative transcriptional regulator [Deinococcus ruber]|uniref:Transcriptional regulator n=1 Tax=Deinococcus ruber TaxID=1848197 RepID=A0A918FGI4_9DEIO|nr:FMN-binding negative transcriptional regulator [Deinococcus ruber]GGR36334.1 transcriptional regulator [Deinococcus ruber]